MTRGEPGIVIRNLRAVLVRHDGAGLPDAELLDCFIAQRDEAAFAALVHRHGPMVLGVCRRVLRNDADAEDAFQATFLVLVRKAATLDRRGALGNWLYGVAHNTALKAKAMNSRRRVREQRAGQQLPSAADADLWPELQALLDTELSQLPEKYRTPLVLCELEGKTLKDAAQQLGCPPGTVASRLARGRTMLARRLARQGLPLSAAALAAALASNTATAAVPPTLLVSTVKAASSCAAGSVVLAGGISAKVAALTDGVMKAMLWTRLKGILGMMLVVGTLTGTAAVCTLPVGANEPDQGTEQAPQKADPAAAQGAFYKEKMVLRPQRDPGDQIFLAVLSADGKILVCGMASGCKLLDVATGRELAVLKLPAVQAAAVSPAGNILATGNLDALKLWDATTGRALAVVEDKTKNIANIAFSPDGKQLATAEATGLRVWDTATGKEIHRLPADRPAERVVLGVAFAPDGKMLASAETGAQTVKLWDTATGKEVATLTGHAAGTLDVAISPDGKLLASAGGDGQVKLWDIASKQETMAVQRQTNGRHSLAFSPDGKLLATTGRDTNDVMLWDVKSGKDVLLLKHAGQVWSVMFSRDGTLLITAGDDGIRIWEATKK